MAPSSPAWSTRTISSSRRLSSADSSGDVVVAGLAEVAVAAAAVAADERPAALAPKGEEAVGVGEADEGEEDDEATEEDAAEDDEEEVGVEAALMCGIEAGAFGGLLAFGTLPAVRVGAGLENGWAGRAGGRYACEARVVRPLAVRDRGMGRRVVSIALGQGIGGSG